uniref:Uncharacterized protein n=1 Tax=Romanomermis culicivorax TaxID=13658 RepID=A0A915L798_ROMCU
MLHQQFCQSSTLKPLEWMLKRRSAIEADASILMSFKLSFHWCAKDFSLLANNFDTKLDSDGENFGASDYSLI